MFARGASRYQTGMNRAAGSGISCRNVRIHDCSLDNCLLIPVENVVKAAKNRLSDGFRVQQVAGLFRLFDSTISFVFFTYRNLSTVGTASSRVGSSNSTTSCLDSGMYAILRSLGKELGYGDALRTNSK